LGSAQAMSASWLAPWTSRTGTGRVQEFRRVGRGVGEEGGALAGLVAPSVRGKGLLGEGRGGVAPAFHPYPPVLNTARVGRLQRRRSGLGRGRQQPDDPPRHRQDGEPSPCRPPGFAVLGLEHLGFPVARVDEAQSGSGRNRRRMSRAIVRRAAWHTSRSPKVRKPWIVPSATSVQTATPAARRRSA
jgi:hypothetical protein